MLKKTVSLFVSLIFILGITTYGAIPERLEGAVCANELSLFDDLGLLPPGFLDSFKPNKLMNRGKFATLLSSYMGYDKGIGVSDESPYNDVPETHPDFEGIIAASQYGIMNGNGDGNFNPDSELTYVQAIKVIMSALGYDELAIAYGGYPFGYIKAANEANLLDELNIGTYDDSARGSDIILLLASALDVRILEYTGIKGGNLSLSTDSKNTVLSLYHHIDVYNARLNGVYGKQAANIEPLASNEVLLGDKVYRIQPSKNYEKYFGFDVTFYYNRDTKECVSVMAESDNNKVITLNSDDIISVEDNVIKYYDGVKEKTLRYTSSADIVYNGRLYSGFVPKDFTIKGTISDFIDAGADGSIDVISVRCIENYVVKSVNVSKRTIYDMYTSTSISVDNDDDLIFRDQLGYNIEFEELSQYDVVSVIRSRDGLITLMTLSNRETEGVIEEINQDDGTIVINGCTYSIAPSFLPYHTISIGQSGLFPLDINGNIAAMKPYQDSYKLAYFIDAYTSKAIDSTTYVKLLSEDGTIVSLKVAKKFICDGKTYNSRDIISLLSENGNVKKQLMRYYLVKGELRAIDTLAEGNGGTDDSLELMYSGKSLIYNRYQSVFGAKIPVSTDTVVFMVPEDASNEDDYRVYSKSTFTHDRSYSIDAYSIKAGGHIADAVVMVGKVSGITSSTSVTLIESVNQVVDEDGDVTACIKGYCDGKYVSYIVKDTVVMDELKSLSDSSKKHNLVCGDVVKLGIDKESGKVSEITLYYEKETNTIKKSVNVGTNVSSSDRMFQASVYSFADGVVRLTDKDLSSSGIKLTYDDTESIVASTFYIYSYKIERDKPSVSVASASDLIDYGSSETDFSKVLMFSAYANPGTLIIYN